MTKTGAQLVCESLLHEGVGIVFGIPGGAVIPLYHSLADYPIHHVLMRHEQGAIHAADGYARATGSVGVCLTTSGPGATNLTTGLATAHMAHSPIVAVSGQAPLPVLGTDAFQEVDIVSIIDAVTKHNYLATDPEQLPQIIREAFHVARTGQPGPVLIVVSNDVQTDESEYFHPDRTHLPGYDPVEQPCSPDRDGRGRCARRPVAQTETGDGMLQAVVRQICDSTREEILMVADPVGDMPDPEAGGPGSLLGPGILATKGFALPAAIGVQTALPHEQVWVLAGNDGFQATVQELATVVQENLPIRIAIVNRGRTAAEYSATTPATKKAPPGDRLLGPHFVRLAEAYGIPGLQARNKQEAGSAIAHAHASAGPILIDFRF